ncbi:Sec8_exocyst domain-containing protein, partial [Haematococcus lacustris]
MAKPAGRSVSGREQVDWEYINEELRDIPADFREQRFHALKHVVDIFSSGDPQGKTAQIRDHEARIGDLVDMVVEGYYTGFAHSIQSYSQILQQFQDARQQVRP